MAHLEQSRRTALRLGGMLCLCALLLAPGAAAQDAPGEAATMLRRLETGSVAEQVAAARWLGLHLVEEAGGPFDELLGRPALDRDLAVTVRLMADILRRPHLLRFRTPDEVLAHLDDPDAGTRADAVRHTAYFDLRKAADRVAGRLADPEPLVREEALIALVYLNDRDHAEAAFALLADPEGAVRVRAFEYLHRLDDPGSIDRLAVLAGDPNRWVAEPVTRQLASGPRAGEALSALLRQARDCPDAERTARYLGALHRFGALETWPAGSREALEAFLEHEEESVRVVAASLLSATDADAARRVLEPALASPVASNRLAATRALTVMEARTAPALVARLLDDPDPDVRRAAVDLAAGLPLRQRRGVYLEVLERPDAPEALLTLVLAAFPEVGQEQDAALLLRHAREATSDFVRMNAANALAGLEERTGTREGHAWYVEVLGDAEEDAAVKRAVLGAIERAGDATYLPLLADTLRACAPEQSDLAAALARTISLLLGRKLHGPDFGAEEAR